MNILGDISRQSRGLRLPAYPWARQCEFVCRRDGRYPDVPTPRLRPSRARRRPADADRGWDPSTSEFRLWSPFHSTLPTGRWGIAIVPLCPLLHRVGAQHLHIIRPFKRLRLRHGIAAHATLHLANGPHPAPRRLVRAAPATGATIASRECRELGGDNRRGAPPLPTPSRSGTALCERVCLRRYVERQGRYG